MGGPSITCLPDGATPAALLSDQINGGGGNRSLVELMKLATEMWLWILEGPWMILSVLSQASPAEGTE